MLSRRLQDKVRDRVDLVRVVKRPCAVLRKSNAGDSNVTTSKCNLVNVLHERSHAHDTRTFHEPRKPVADKKTEKGEEDGGS